MTYSDEEKRAAAERVIELMTAKPRNHSHSSCLCDLVGGDDDCKIDPPYKSEFQLMHEVALELQTQVNRQQLEIEEARELLNGSYSASDVGLAPDKEWEVDLRNWFSRNTESK